MPICFKFIKVFLELLIFLLGEYEWLIEIAFYKENVSINGHLFVRITTRLILKVTFIKMYSSICTAIKKFKKKSLLALKKSLGF